VSNIHAYMDTGDQVAPASAPTSMDAIVSLRAAATELTAGVVAGFLYRRTLRRIERFPDHRLHDMGFERDWDGSVIPRQQ
jgi:uncharacterized protein YjiS (DUF1127 family)